MVPWKPKGLCNPIRGLFPASLGHKPVRKVLNEVNPEMKADKCFSAVQTALESIKALALKTAQKHGLEFDWEAMAVPTLDSSLAHLPDYDLPWAYKPRPTGKFISIS
jgi:hypothetical protein